MAATLLDPAAPAADRASLIECRALTKDYRLPAETIHALRGIDLSIRAGEFVAFMGPSGSGKSTLLNIIGTMDTATGGTCMVDGRDLAALTENQRRLLRRDTLGFIFQEFHLVPTLTALENVLLPGLFGGAPVTAQHAHDLLKAVGLDDRAESLPRTLSGGQRQRVAIARALAHNPKLLLADEPTGNLDSDTGLGLMALFRDLATTRNLTVLMVTHDQLMAARADRIITLRDGRLEG